MVRATVYSTVEVEAEDLAALGSKVADLKAASRVAGKLTRWEERSISGRQKPKERPQADSTERAQDRDEEGAMDAAAGVNEAAALP